MPLEVLVVSEDARVREEVVDGLGSDWTIHFSSDARAAGQDLRKFTPGVIVVDMRTGNAGGYALARDMAQDGRLDEVPILVLIERPQDSWLAKMAGADLVRTKPVSSEQLVRDIRSLHLADAS